MALLYAENVADVLRDYMDEPSAAWIDNGRLQRFLEQGYEEFRSNIAKIDPTTFTAEVNITMTSAYTYDLSSNGAEPVTLLGPTPTATRLIRLLKVFVPDTTTGEPVSIFRHAASLRELKTAWDPGWDERMVMLDGTLLRFSESINETLTVRYVPESTVDWSRTTAGDNEYIDDLVAWHDLIALYAYRQYAIMDMSENPTVERQLAMRMREFAEYVAARDEEAGAYVHREWLL